MDTLEGDTIANEQKFWNSTKSNPEAGQGAIGDIADVKDNGYDEISKASSKVLRTHVKLVKMHWLKI